MSRSQTSATGFEALTLVVVRLRGAEGRSAHRWATDDLLEGQERARPGSVRSASKHRMQQQARISCIHLSFPCSSDDTSGTLTCIGETFQ